MAKPSRIDLLITHERELREQGEADVEKARQIQFEEYARRLAELNHAHQRFVEERATTVSRDTFDAYVRDSSREREFLAQRLQATLDATESADRVRMDGLDHDIEIERNARIRNEGAISSMRFLLVLLGLPGIVAIALGLFAVFAPH